MQIEDTKTTAYYLDRPGAWGQFGLGVLLLIVPLSLIVVFSIPGVFAQVFPNAPKQMDPLGIATFTAVGVGALGSGIYYLYKAIRTLRDRGPKLEFTPTGVIDYRGLSSVDWDDIMSASYAMEKTGDRYQRAVVSLTVRSDSGGRVIDIDVRGLSKSPEAIFNRLKMITGLA
ncbi:MAG: hypothetical protein QM703_22630 [Gemmatales bacterium]